MTGTQAFNPEVHDIREIAALMWQAWKADGFILENDPTEWMAYLQGQLPDSPLCSFVTLETKGKVTGFISLAPTDSGDARHLMPWLANLFVLAEFRNQGLAGCLEAMLEEEARYRGFTSLYTWAAPGSVEYHQRQGYVWLDEVLNVMVKQLG